MAKSLAHERCKDELIQRLRNVRSEIKARWGRMSARQMVCHLADALRMATGEQPVSPRSNLVTRTFLKWYALSLPIPWPRGFPTSPELNQEKGAGTKPGDFAADVAQVETLLDFVSQPATSLEGNPHPVLGRLSHQAWMRWSYLHMDHHLRQFGA